MRQVLDEAGTEDEAGMLRSESSVIVGYIFYSDGASSCSLKMLSSLVMFHKSSSHKSCK